MIGWVASIVIGVLVYVGAAAVLRVLTAGEIELMRQRIRRVVGACASRTVRRTKTR